MTDHDGLPARREHTADGATRDAIETSRRVALVEATGSAWKRGGRDGPAGTLMLVLSATLVLAQWQLVHDDASGLTDDYGETIAAIVLGLAGMRCIGTNGVHPIAAAFAFLAGVWLIFQGFVFAHPNGALAGVEVTVGVLAVLAAAAAGSEAVLDR